MFIHSIFHLTLIYYCLYFTSFCVEIEWLWIGHCLLFCSLVILHISFVIRIPLVIHWLSVQLFLMFIFAADCSFGGWTKSLTVSVVSHHLLSTDPWHKCEKPAFTPAGQSETIFPTNLFKPWFGGNFSRALLVLGFPYLRSTGTPCIFFSCVFVKWKWLTVLPKWSYSEANQGGHKIGTQLVSCAPYLYTQPRVLSTVLDYGFHNDLSLQWKMKSYM